jgi:hypothetical protein
MTNRNKSESRDDVLLAFHQQYSRPTAEQIIEWTHRFPQFAEDIRAHAAVAWDWDTNDALLVAEPDESLLARGYSQALNAIYNADNSVPSDQNVAASQSFSQMIAACGKDVRQLARELEIERGVIADLVGGRMLPPIGERFVTAIVGALSQSKDAFCSALEFALHTPQQLGHAKADQMPTVIAQPYEEIIRRSGMSDERKQYWLSED